MNETPIAPAPPAAAPARARWVLPAILGFYLVCALAAQSIIRMDYGPDEWLHLQYAHVLANEHRLPVIQDTHMAIRPPLYYLPLAAIWRAFGVRQAPSSLPIGPAALSHMTPESLAARHVTRAFSALLGCLVLLVCWWILEAAGVGLPARGYLLFGLAALPVFQQMGGVTNSDLASALQSALVCLFLIRSLRDGHCDARRAAWLGALLGLGLWIKETTLYAAPLAAYVVWASGERRGRWRRLAAFAGGVVAVGGWWPLHSYLVLGSFNPCPVRPYNQPPLRQVLSHPVDTLWSWLMTILQTFVLPDWSWRFIPGRVSRLLSRVGVVLLIALWLIGLRRGDRFERRLRGLGLAGCALLVAGVLEYTTMADWRACIGGRYLLSGLPWLAVLLAGSVPLLRGLPRAPRILGPLFVGLLVLVDLAWWLLAWDFYTSIHP